MSKRVLITGGLGFIGSNLVEWIYKNRPDWNIVVLDAMTYAGRLDNIPEEIRNSLRFFLVTGNVEDKVTVDNVVSQCNTVFHLAAESHVDNSISTPGNFVDANVKGTQIILDAVNKYKINRLIYVSSSEVYGTSKKGTMNESHPLEPLSPYAATKAAGDRLSSSYCSTYNTPVVIVRPFNNYGPRQHPEKLIPQCIIRILRGEHYDIHGDGLATRDWLYVEDTCRAMVMAAEVSGIEGEVFNLGTGVDVSVKGISDAIQSRLGVKEFATFTKDRPAQVQRQICDAWKAREILGWQVEYKLAKGLDKTVGWYQTNHKWWEAYTNPAAGKGVSS